MEAARRGGASGPAGPDGRWMKSPRRKQAGETLLVPARVHPAAVERGDGMRRTADPLLKATERRAAGEALHATRDRTFTRPIQSKRTFRKDLNI